MLHRLYTYRVTLVILLVVVAGLLTPQVQKAVVIDNSLKIWFLADDPGLKDYHQFQELFGNDEMVILMIKEEQLWRKDSALLSLKALSKALSALPDVAHVLGAGNTRLLDYRLTHARVRSLIPEPFDEELYLKNKEQLSFLNDQLFSKDEKVTRVVIQLKKSDDFDDRRGEIISSVKAVANEYFAPSQNHWGGIGIIYDGLNRLSQADFGKFLMSGYALMFVVLWLLFRRIQFVLFALSTVLLATWYSLALYGFMDLRLNLLTVLLPLIIVLLGVLDVLHINYAWLAIPEKEHQNDHLKRLKITWAHTWSPCLLTTLTTMIGFLALTVTPMPILRVFGFYSAIGIGLSLLFSWILASVILPMTTETKSLAYAALLNRTDWESKFSKSRIWKGVSLALIVISVYGVSVLKIDSDTFGYFPADHEVVLDHEFMVDHWGPYMPIELLIEVPDDLNLADPVWINKLTRLDSALCSIVGIHEVMGYHQLIKGALQAKYKGDVESAMMNKSRVNKTFKLIRQYYPRLYKHYIASDHTIRMTLLGEVVSSSVLRRKIGEMEEVANAQLGGGAKGKIAGYQPMYASIVDYVAKSQLYSLALALVLIFILLYVFLKDFRMAFLALLSNLFPLLILFGFIGINGINLDSATASVAAIALSFCVDDTIHFVYRYNTDKAALKDRSMALSQTLNYIMPIIIITSVLLIFGYGLMSLGSLQTVKYFGLLTIVTILGALYSQLIIFPYLIRKFDR